MQVAPHVVQQLQNASRCTDPSRQHKARTTLEAALRTLEASAELAKHLPSGYSLDGETITKSR